MGNLLGPLHDSNRYVRVGGQAVCSSGHQSTTRGSVTEGFLKRRDDGGRVGWP